MKWLEFLVPAVVLIVATPSVAIAYIYTRAAPSSWSKSLLGFLLAAAGVSLLTAIGIFLRASEIIGSFILYFIIWNLSFIILALASWLAIATGLNATGSKLVRRARLLFGLWSGLSYIATLSMAVGGKGDFYFPYIGGTYAATALYLFVSLGYSLYIVLREREKLSEENKGTLHRFLRFFPPFCGVFLFDEGCRALLAIRLPWPPLLPLAPLTLYVFSNIELLGRLRRPEIAAKAAAGQTESERRAMAISAGCSASPLTFRERGVLIELLNGASNASIASNLGISLNTVKNHVYSIFQKTGAGSRSELLLLADRGAVMPESQETTVAD